MSERTHTQTIHFEHKMSAREELEHAKEVREDISKRDEEFYQKHLQDPQRDSNQLKQEYKIQLLDEMMKKAWPLVSDVLILAKDLLGLESLGEMQIGGRRVEVWGRTHVSRRVGLSLSTWANQERQTKDCLFKTPMPKPGTALDKANQEDNMILRNSTRGKWTPPVGPLELLSGLVTTCQMKNAYQEVFPDLDEEEVTKMYEEVSYNRTALLVRLSDLLGITPMSEGHYRYPKIKAKEKKEVEEAKEAEEAKKAEETPESTEAVEVELDERGEAAKDEAVVFDTDGSTAKKAKLTLIHSPASPYDPYDYAYRRIEEKAEAEVRKKFKGRHVSEEALGVLIKDRIKERFDAFVLGGGGDGGPGGFSGNPQTDLDDETVESLFD